MTNALQAARADRRGADVVSRCASSSIAIGRWHHKGLAGRSKASGEFWGRPSLGSAALQKIAQLLNLVLAVGGAEADT